MKKELLLFPLFLSLLNFVSAYSYSLGNSINELGRFVDIPSLILILLFAIFFFIFLKIFTKMMGERNKSSSGVISFILSLFLVWLVNRTDIISNIENFSDSLGFSEGIFSVIIPILVIIFIIYLMIKIGYLLFLVSGAGLILLVILTDYIYQEGFTIFLGILLFLIGIILWRKKKKKEKNRESGDLENEKSKKIKYRKIAEEQRRVEAQRDAEAQREAEEGQRRIEAQKRAKEQGEAEEEQRRREEEQRKVEVQRKAEEKFNSVRKVGIRNLEKQLEELEEAYQKGIQSAEELHKQATKLGWTKAGSKPRKGESSEEHKKRAAEASEVYKEWYRQYTKNINLEKQIKEIRNRIEHLKKKIRR